MVIDLALALVVSAAIALLASTHIIARSRRGAAAIVAACAVAAFVVGCGQPAQQSQTTTAPAPAPVAATLPPVKFSPAQLAVAHHAKGGGGISVDVLDVRPNGTQHSDGVTIGATDALYVIGWAYDDAKRARCNAVGLLVDGTRVVPGSYGYPRSDVAAFYKDPKRMNVGYGIVVPPGTLGAGAHVAQVVCVAAQDARTTPRTFNVTVE